ncbi:MAG: hypothetical protein JXA06_02440 [Bacteroidetes bacterium]|nr:hypothetical protein [Bacteroidota bacterium]
MQTEEKKRKDYFEYLSILWRSRRVIVIATASITILAAVISFILPESFKSTAILLPDTDKSKLASLGSISNLASLAGLNIGGEVATAKLYPTIIKSESVLRNVIYSKYRTNEYEDSVDLIRYWKIKENTPERDYEVAQKALREKLSISMDAKTSVLTMSIETEEPRLSADILNNIICEADDFIRTKRNTNALEQRKWIEARLEEVKADLAKSENNLKIFREKNRVVSGSPQLLLNQERLIREVEINSAMYIELKKQYELARIEEIRTTPIINVLDYGRAAAKKEHPKKAVIIFVSIMLALFLSGSYCIVIQKYSRQINDWRNKFKTLK